jgi:hypothetical protein
VEFLVGYSKPKFVMANLGLEFIVESKFPTSSLERCVLVTSNFLVRLYRNLLNQKILFYSIVMFNLFSDENRIFLVDSDFCVVSFLVKPSWQCSFDSSLCSPPPLMIIYNPLGACPNINKVLACWCSPKWDLVQTCPCWQIIQYC